VGRCWFGPARERAIAKLEGGRYGIWPCCDGEGEGLREAETQEGSDSSLGLTAWRRIRAPAWSKALKAI
jgi:hypothetical protein